MKLVLIFVTVILLMIAGCGGSDAPSSADQEPVYGHLPPDPGEAGKVTLEGIDSDNDGVRDDLQIAIYKRYPDNPEARAALEQNAKALQAAVLAGSRGDVEEIFKVAKSKGQATVCLHVILNTREASTGRSFVEAMTTNTQDRIEAYLKYNQALSGHAFGFDGIDTVNPCD